MSLDCGSDESSGLRKRAEEKAREQVDASPENLSALSEEARRLFHELRVHQIELEIQNEELRRAQVELEAARTRYFDLYDLAPVGYFTLSEKGLILEANLTAASLLGVGRSALVKQPLSRFILSDDQDIYYRFRKRLFETDAPQVCDLRIVNGGGSPFWARMEVTVTQDGESGVPICRAVVSDITERKQAEERLQQAHNELEQRVAAQTKELRWANEELRKEVSEHKQAEELLRESEKRFRAIADYTYDWESWIGLDGKLIWVNPAVLSLTGYSAEECLGMADFPLPIIHEADLERMAQQFAAALQGSSGNNVDFQIRCKDGDRKWGAASYQPIYYSAGVSVGYRLSVRDITERKRAEEALRMAEQNFRRSLDESPLGVRIVTAEGETLYANKATLNIYGYDRIEELRTTPAKKRYTPESYVGHQKRKEQRQRGEDTPSEYEISIVTTKGDIRHLQVFRKEVLWNNEKQVQALYHDITERKRLEEILKQERQDLKLIIDSSPIIVFYKDKEGRLLRVNKTFSEALKMPEESVVGKTVFNLYSPEIAQGMTDDDHEVLKSGRSKLNIIERYESASGIRWVQTDKIPIFDKNGIAVGIIGFSQDITERKRAEEEGETLLEQLKLGRKRLKDLSQRLVELQETERRELARELHDNVGQSLTALIINLKIIQNVLPEEIRNRVSARIDDSRKLVEETVICIRDVMARLRPPVLDDYGLLAALRWYSQQFKERTGLVMEVIGEELNPRLPLEKETALFRIVQEALNNVAKHAKASQVTLILESGDGKGRLTIADDGIGFDPKAHHQPGSRPEWGVISMRERAEAIEGKFYIEISPGKGTKIIVEVPRNKSNAECGFRNAE